LYRGIVFFDCDGVLTIDDSSWMKLHKYFNSIDNSYFARLYREGLISYLDWMKIDIALMIQSWGKPIRYEDVVKALDDIRVREEALYTVKMLKERGFLVGVISSGVDLLVKRICSSLNVDICLYNELFFYENQLVPGGRAWVPLLEKPFLVEKISSGLGFSLDKVVYVGDSIWDKHVFEVVGLPIAIYPCRDLEDYVMYCVKKLDEIPDIVDEYFRRFSS